MPPEPPVKKFSPGDILHLENEEANLLNTYLKSTFVRTVVSVSLTKFN